MSSAPVNLSQALAGFSDIFTVAKGTEHKPSSPGGAILLVEPAGTMTTGDRHEGDIPAHVDSTVGHEIGQVSA
jgi:hypothetical protein